MPSKLVSPPLRLIGGLILLLFASAILNARVSPQLIGPDSQPVVPSQYYSFGPAPQNNLGPIDDGIRDQPAHDGLLRVAAHRKLKREDLSRAIWQKGGEGRVWRLSFRSADAIGIRLHFSNFSIGDGQVWVHDTQNPPRQVFGPYTGKGRNDDGDFWTEIVFSDAIEVEYQPASGTPSNAQPPFQISELSHFWQFGGKVAPRHTAALAGFNPAADSGSTSKNYSCLRDVSCYTAESFGGGDSRSVWEPSYSTAILIFGDSTGTYQCSGTMLNAANKSPLLLTAGHCINTEEQARSVVALFQAMNSSCQGLFSPLTSSQAARLPQATGSHLLSYANRPFLNEGSQEEIHNDLDYSLVLLKSLPNAYVGFSGYNARPVLPGNKLVSVSSPYAMYLKFAFSTVLPNPWDNGFDVDQSMLGRIGPGSSGSGVFDSNWRLVGVLSTGSAPCSKSSDCPSATTCDVNGNFHARYTSFSAVYPFIRSYLLPSVDPVPEVTSNPSVFSAGQIVNVNEAGYGDSTLTLNAGPNFRLVEIHVESPDGPLFYAGSATASATAAGWVTDGTTFHLQDVSNGQPLTSANTIAVAVAHIDSPLLTAMPPFILFPDGLGNGSMTLNWNVPGARFLELHAGSPAGPLLSFQGSSSGWARAQGWVSDGMKFILCEVSNSSCSTQNTVATLTASVQNIENDPNAGAEYGSLALAAFPNPIPVAPGQVLGQTTLYWRAPGNQEVQVHVGNSNGPLMATAGSAGSVRTGVWVEDGTRFCITNTFGTELASVVVHFAKP